jgi:hypothetical protein
MNKTIRQVLTLLAVLGFAVAGLTARAQAVSGPARTALAAFEEPTKEEPKEEPKKEEPAKDDQKSDGQKKDDQQKEPPKEESPK